MQHNSRFNVGRDVEVDNAPTVVIENGIKPPSLTQGARELCTLLLKLCRGSRPRSSHRIAKRFRSGLTEADPKVPSFCPHALPEKFLLPEPTHPWHRDQKDKWEDAKMPKPAHEWRNHNDEQEDGFQDGGMQRSSLERQQSKGHGERDQVAFSTQGPEGLRNRRKGPKPTGNDHDDSKYMKRRRPRLNGNDLLDEKRFYF